MSHSRCIMIIHKRIPYERIEDKNINVNPTVAVKIKTKKHENLVIVGHYRQWKLPGEDSPFTKEGIQRQVKRFKEFEESLHHFSAHAQHMLLIGDYNVDQLPENNPLSCPEVRALQPVMDRIAVSFGLKCMNNDPTRFFQGQRPSLLDLCLPNDPQSLSEIANIKTGLSDHDGVT